MNKPNFGLDAPKVIKTLFIVSVLSITLLAVLLVFYKEATFFKYIIAAFFLINFIVNILIGTNMVLYSKLFKIIYRNKLIEKLNINGNEIILDIGCGRGLYTIGFAELIKNGKVYGIDIWNPGDISENSESSIMQNIKITNTGEKIILKTEDMRSMSFENNYFDIVIGSFSIHNISNKNERKKALNEIARVTKIAGKVIIIDFKNIKEYKQYFLKNGFIIENDKYVVGSFPFAKSITLKKLE